MDRSSGRAKTTAAELLSAKKLALTLKVNFSVQILHKKTGLSRKK
jgi:hypothetical protein